MTFQELGLSSALQQATEALGFVEPTPVQAQAIPYMLTTDKDLVTLSQTGTGKTAAFGFPLLEITSQEPRAKSQDSLRALVLAPTRELCIQIAKDLRNYAQFLPEIRIVPVYGGEDIRKQLMALEGKAPLASPHEGGKLAQYGRKANGERRTVGAPQIIVATPGRLIDLMKRGKVRLDNIQYLVLDEADEMLDMGFQEDIETILAATPMERRTMLFSATMPREVEKIASQYMREYETIQIGSRNAGTENVDHIYFVCRAGERYLVLKRIVDLNPDIYAIVFCRTKAETQEIAEKLIKDGYNADALHGDLSQAARDNVMQRFRMKSIQILVATDVAARGLDVHNLTHVINYQLPDDPEVYTHRSGRTGRANKRGISVNIVHQRETRRITNLEKMLQREFRRVQIPSGLEVCKKQLFYQINKLQQPVSLIGDSPLQLPHEGERSELLTALSSLMNEAVKQLDYLTKEELIHRLVAQEFGRFLEYYKDAKDLNVQERTKDKGQRTKDSKDTQCGRKKNGRTVRLKINVGMRDGMNPKRFLGLVNETTRDRTIMIGDIEIAKNYTFFDVYQDQRDKVVRAFSIYEDLFVLEAKGRREASTAPLPSPRRGGRLPADRGNRPVSRKRKY